MPGRWVQGLAARAPSRRVDPPAVGRRPNRISSGCAGRSSGDRRRRPRRLRHRSSPWTPIAGIDWGIGGSPAQPRVMRGPRSPARRVVQSPCWVYAHSDPRPCRRGGGPSMFGLHGRREIGRGSDEHPPAPARRGTKRDARISVRSRRRPSKHAQPSNAAAPARDRHVIVVDR